MKHSYDIHGMQDARSAGMIEQALMRLDGIVSVEVSTDPPRAVITMHHHISKEELNAALSAVGPFHLVMTGGHMHHAHAEHHAGHGGMAHHGHGGGHDGMGHDHHHHMMMEDFRKRLLVTLVLMIPVVLLSPMIQHWLGFSWTFPGDHYVEFVLSSIIYFYGGWPFLKGLYDEVWARTPGMMTLIGMAITVAYLYSAGTTFGLPGESFYWELATLVVIMLAGHWIEMRSVLGASRALELLVSLLPAEAHKVQNGTIKEVKLEALDRGDVVLVKPGEKVPADGVITDGESYLNESMLTGESRPVRKTTGEKVIGGSINGNGSLHVRVEATGKDSYLSKVVAMVAEAQKSKSRMQNLANRAAKWLTYLALGAGLLTLIIWLAVGREFVFALERMVTVMVISCPHALGLAVPLVVAISTAIAAQKGLLIRNRTAFEEARRITALIFDKTGTLTFGKFGVTRFESVNDDFNKNEILRLAAALEQHSEHPIAAGIVEKAGESVVEIPKAEDFEAIPGKGVQAMVEGREVKVVSPGYLRETGMDIPKDAYGSAAETVVFVMIDQRLAGFIALADELRPESIDAIRTFRDHHIKVYMATGDNEQVAAAVSAELGLDGYYAEVLPHEKLEIVKALQQQGEFVAMTGDGVNDAPALARADIGIAVGSGTDVAAETADIILVNSNPKDIAHLILFGKATYRKMVQNLVWATGYNAFAIPLAAGVLAPLGVMLSPAVGAVLMSLSTIIVAVNAQLLKQRL